MSVFWGLFLEGTIMKLKSVIFLPWLLQSLVTVQQYAINLVTFMNT